MTEKPQIIMENWEGLHNKQNRAAGLLKGSTYKDLSTICIIPTRGMIPAKVVQNWLGLFSPMNQKFFRMFMIGMEVGEAYNNGIATILHHPELKKWKYLMTMEEDNMPPPDGILRLFEALEGGVDGKKYDAVGGLYWTKGEEGQPMIYGDPKVWPLNFIPQVPKPDTVQECRGLGMGFNLYRLEMFKDKKIGEAHMENGLPVIDKPWFKTVAEYDLQKGSRSYTQDLYFYENAGKEGYRFACDTRVRVGHLDVNRDIIW